MMTDIDFEKFEILSEDEKKKVAADWTDEEWFNYLQARELSRWKNFVLN